MLTTLLTAAALSLPVTVHDGSCPGMDPRFNDGCYLQPVEQVWVLGGERNAWTYRHEMGHAFVAQRMDAGERNRFSCLPGVKAPPNSDWERCGNWDVDLEEVAADAYANCAMGATNPRSDYFSHGRDYSPTSKRRHLHVCRFINRAAD